MIHFDEPERPKLEIPFVGDYVGADVPRADRFGVMRCPNNSHAHVVLFADNEPIAQFTVSLDGLEVIVAGCEAVFTAPSMQ